MGPLKTFFKIFFEPRTGKKRRPGKPSSSEDKSWPSGSSADQINNMRVGMASGFLVLSALPRSRRSKKYIRKTFAEHVQLPGIEPTDRGEAFSSGENHLPSDGKNDGHPFFVECVVDKPCRTVHVTDQMVVGISNLFHIKNSPENDVPARYLPVIPGFIGQSS